VLKVVTTLAILDFPVVCLMAWGFDITAEGVRPVPPMPRDTTPPPQPSARGPVSTTDESATLSIAVLPFVDMSAGHDQQYLGDGTAEGLLNALASIDGLNVAVRTSFFSFHGKDVTVKEIGDMLHARHVLEGSVRRSGQKLRVTTQLIDVDTGFHLFSQSCDREFVAALMPKLGIGRDANLVKQGTTNLEAFNLWLKAHEWLRNPNPIAVDAALEHLRQAVELDPR